MNMRSLSISGVLVFCVQASAQILNSGIPAVCEGNFRHTYQFQVVPGSRYRGEALSNHYTTYSAGMSADAPRHKEVSYSQIASVEVRDAKGTRIAAFHNTPIQYDGLQFDHQRGSFVPATAQVAVEIAGVCQSWAGMAGQQTSFGPGLATFSLYMYGPKPLVRRSH